MSERDEHTVTVDGSTLLPGLRLQDCRLEVVAGPDRGASFALRPGHVIVGASRRCDIRLADPTVSSRHARLTLMPDGVRVEDLGSKNGTSFQGSRVTSIVVQAGATLALGATHLALVPPASPDEVPLDATRYGELQGQSLAWRKLFATLARLESSTATVLLQGETGVGKSAVARAIHEHSPRRARAMATVDCGAVAPSLLPGELFGHVRGAFTGADRDREGLVAAAEGSTLLLEEIGDLPLELQPTLLRLLETRQYLRVGEARPRRADVRVIAATHHDLRQAAGGAMRQDLYYRLSVITLRVPPLRECREDIVPLALRFLAQQGVARELTPGQRALLENYDWPGNARQLRNTVERFAVTGAIFGDALGAATPAARWAEGDFHAHKAEVVRQFERDYLVALLQATQGNLSAAARQSGLARNHLRELLRRHGIEVERYR